LGLEAGHSLPFSAEVKNDEAIPSFQTRVHGVVPLPFTSKKKKKSKGIPVTGRGGL
jgi:hypothetical protein